MTPARLLRALALAVLVVLGCGPALAQDETVIDVRTGYNGTLVPGAWNAVRVALTGGQRPIEGTIEVAVLTGGERTSASVRPFATTPGKTVAYDVPVFVRTADRYGLREREVVTVVRDRRSRVIGRWLASPTARLASETINTHAGGLWERPVLTSRPGMISAIAPDEFESTRWVATLSPVHVGPASLWSHHLAYDAVSVLVLDTSDLARIAPASRDAILRWLAAGGHLILVGPEILIVPEWAPEGVTLSDLPSPAQDGADTAWPEMTRVLVGHGVWTHLGQRPEEVGWSQDEVGKAWRALTAPASPLPAERLAAGENRWMAWGTEDEGESDRIDAIVSSFVDVRPPTLWWLVVFLGVLAVCVGPVDRLILKRTKRLHFSAFSVTLWIALASVLATIIPSLLRSGETWAGTHASVDVALDGTAYEDAVHVAFAPTGARVETGTDGAQRPLLDPRRLSPRTVLTEGARFERALGVRPFTLLAYGVEREVQPELRAELAVVDGSAAVRITSEREYQIGNVSVVYRGKSHGIIRALGTVTPDTPRVADLASGWRIDGLEEYSPGAEGRLRAVYDATLAGNIAVVRFDASREGESPAGISTGDKVRVAREVLTYAIAVRVPDAVAELIENMGPIQEEPE